MVSPPAPQVMSSTVLPWKWLLVLSATSEPCDDSGKPPKEDLDLPLAHQTTEFSSISGVGLGRYLPPEDLGR